MEWIPCGIADGRPEYVLSSCEASLKRLGVDVIDLYYQHRVDPTVPVEETFGAMAKLVEQGKVRALGISEAKPETIRKTLRCHESVRRIAENYHLPYYSITPTFTICPEHGYIPGEHFECPY